MTSYVFTTAPTLPISESVDEVDDTSKQITIPSISSQEKSRLKTTGLGLLALATTAIIVRYMDNSFPLVLQGIRSIQIDMKSYVLLTVIVGGIASFQLINSEQSINDRVNNDDDDDEDIT